MSLNVKKFFLWVIAFSIIWIGSFAFWNPKGNAPSFESDFAKKLVSSDRNPEGVFDIEWVKGNKTIKENIQCLFYPGASRIAGCWPTSSGYLWNLIRYIAFALVFIFIVFTAINLVISASKKESLKEGFKNLLYVLVGATMIFLATWLFGSLLPFENLQGTEGFSGELIRRWGIFSLILSFLKSLAFLLAIVMIVVTGFRVMAAGDWEKGKKLAMGVVNVVAALLAIKVIDFIYYLAAQQDFAVRAGDFIIQIMKFMGYLAGIAIVVMVIVSGYLFVVDGGSGKSFQKAKGILINILISMMALFFVLFIIYQIFAEFAW